MSNCTKYVSLSLAALLATMSFGCASLKENSLTGSLWQEDPTGSNRDSKPGDKYIYSTFTRATLTPLAVIGDVTVFGLAIGAGLAAEAFVQTCREGAQSGGRITR